jgi:hypothetical protein
MSCDADKRREPVAETEATSATENQRAQPASDVPTGWYAYPGGSQFTALVGRHALDQCHRWTDTTGKRDTPIGTNPTP